jgi:uncharacterized protein YndB with AHSA1/START domain
MTASSTNSGDNKVTANDNTEVFRVLINAPIDRVWAELTRTEVVLPFFFNSKCDSKGLAVGGPLRMRSKNGKYTSVVGEVLEFNPPHRYRHTFKFTNLDDPPCEVAYDLREVDGQTELTLTNINVPAGTKTAQYMNQGGTFITENLKSIIENGKPTLSGRFILFMIALSAPFTPARCRSQNWP